MAKLLTSAGIPCGHEAIFGKTVTPRPEFRADSSFHAVAHLGHPVAKGAQLIHLVRNPLKVIRSWMHGGTSPTNDDWCHAVLNVKPYPRTPEGMARRLDAGHPGL